MWVTQVTEPSSMGEEQDQCAFLTKRFPQYQFSVMQVRPHPFIICKARDETVIYQGDEGKEVEMLRFMLTMLMDDAITGYVITDGM